jgi:hypothetical protein
MDSSTSDHSSTGGAFVESLLSPAGLKAALVGGAGGFFGFVCGEILGRSQMQSLGDLLWHSGLWAGLIGIALGGVILAWQNEQSLRGRWNRDLLPALPLFGALSFLGGAAGQLAFSFVQNSLTRGIGWALMGAGVGVGIGVLRRDAKQAGRGALGGLLGGFIGGLLFDALAMIFSTAGDGAFSRAFGLIVTGAMIAFFMRAVQQAMQGAWLMGVSTGAYEGKEYPLNTARITVGQTELNDIALYRDRAVPARAGALVFENGQWHWQSDSPNSSILLNGRMVTNAVLTPGCQLQIGDTKFSFQSRSLRMNAPGTAVDSGLPSQNYSVQSTPVVTGWQLQNASVPIQISAQGNWTIGRAEENDFAIGDGAVSSRHAKLEANAGVLLITDVGSSNGTFLNGVRLAPNVPTSLRAGDRLRLGSSEFTVHPL